ncbi:hypothetical protein OH768_24255 [Streptomyces sp. NBC_01622]|uniref:hypothetical protein n=1 Tax=Streptomyces sp. NBC_01622 TaxID=2975903 RepID=UPI00386B7E3F|nr:hypothetical protein OH768_24255 [Streptomyces sp. NBC_01622]
MTTRAVAPTARPRPARAGRAVLRLHRPALIAWGVFVAVISAVLLWAYGPGGSAASAAWQRKCSVDLCDVGYAVDTYHLAYRFSEAAIGFLPVLAALWAGGLLIGRELENGTAELAWTQSVGPARWLAAKLAVPAALLTAGTTLLVLLHRLLFDAHQVPKGWNWSDNGTFENNGPIAVAFPLLGLALGALAGLVVHRAVAGLAVAAVATVITRSLVLRTSPHLWPWKSDTSSLLHGYPTKKAAIYGGKGAVTSTGAHIPDPCAGAAKTCPAAHDLVGYYRDYHPSSQFWPLQLTETALILAVAALATTAAFTLLRRRTS